MFGGNMKKAAFALLSVLCSTLISLYSTPSTTFWTPCTMDIQAFRKIHFTYDSYFTIGNKGTLSGGEAFPTDLGLTAGVLPFKKFNMEIGFDWLEPYDYPLFFNFKFGVPESALFTDAPMMGIGTFNIGTEAGVTDQYVTHLMLGKTLPKNLGRLTISGYIGNSATLKDSNRNVENTGFMVAYDKYLYKDKLLFAGDWASGKNVIGGGGFGVYYYLTPDISILMGPVWFNDKGINGKWKWTSQLDANF